LHLLPLAVPLAFLLRPTSHFHNHIIIPHLLMDQARRIASLALHSPTLARARRCDFGVWCSWRRWADAESIEFLIRWLQRTRHPGDIVDDEGTDHRR
ncbi:hypothetical protein B0H16DRAFT_1647588, partial [Mycena metata]